MIIHRGRRRWFWPFRRILSQHAEPDWVNCWFCRIKQLNDSVDLEVMRLFSRARHGKTTITKVGEV